MFENVVGLLEVRFQALLSEVVGRLEAAGYVVGGSEGWVNAAQFGVPQSRKRVIVMGAMGRAVEALTPTGESVTVRDALEGLPRIESYRRLLWADATPWKPGDRPTSDAFTSSYAAGLAGIVTFEGDLGRPRVWDPSLITNSLRTRHSRTTVGRFHRTLPGSVEPRSRLYRLDEDALARTLRAGTGSDRGSHTSPRPIHPHKDRVITVREAARLHGFPDWFRFHSTNWHGHRQIGNSVPPPLARAAGERLVQALGVTPPTLAMSLSLGSDRLLSLGPREARSFWFPGSDS